MASQPGRVRRVRFPKQLDARVQAECDRTGKDPETFIAACVRGHFAAVDSVRDAMAVGKTDAMGVPLVDPDELGKAAFDAKAPIDIETRQPVKDPYARNLVSSCVDAVLADCDVKSSYGKSYERLVEIEMHHRGCTREEAERTLRERVVPLYFEEIHD